MRRHALLALSLLAACTAAPGGDVRPDAQVDDHRGRLPTGRRLDPEGATFATGAFPLSMLPAPGGRRVVLLLSGWKTQGVQVVEPSTRRVVQTLAQPAAFLGAAWSPDSATLYASGGYEDVVYRYRWSGDTLAPQDSIRLGAEKGARYPAGLATSPDGRFLYVAENLGDSLAVVELASGRVVQRLATERYPYAVVVARDGRVFASAWGGSTVSEFHPGASGLVAARRIRVGRHPSALLLDSSGTRLYATMGSSDRVAVVDTRAGSVVAELRDPPALVDGANAPREGSTPNALAWSRDGARLYVAEADNNAVAVFTMAGGAERARLLGRIPADWYPTAVLEHAGALLVANGKGTGTRANPGASQPGQARPRRGAAGPDTSYTLGQIDGTLQVVEPSRLDSASLLGLTARVAAVNGWVSGSGVPGPVARPYPPIRHVIYVIKENRTYDQILGDLRQADGDTSLLYFGRAVTPNHHALAERFGIHDRFFVNAEASPAGHNWSMAAYASDYLEKTVPSTYSDRGRSYDYEGTNRDVEAVPDDDVSEPLNGYLWDLAMRKGITFRNYGEFVLEEKQRDAEGKPAGYAGLKPFLVANTHRASPGFDLDIMDQRRADVWIADFEARVQAGTYPALSILRLPSDHTSGARAGKPTPRAYVADNDLALGRVIEALSRSAIWRETVVFVLEDDAQDGPDHVDSHRSPLLVVSPWAKGGVSHRFANTTDVLRTIEELLGLASLSQFDAYGRPLRDIWRDTPDLRPYVALRPQVDLNERNPSNTRGARDSRHLDLAFEDKADEALFNRILWYTIKGEGVAYPGTRRLSGLDLVRR